MDRTLRGPSLCRYAMDQLCELFLMTAPDDEASPFKSPFRSHRSCSDYFSDFQYRAKTDS